MLQRLTITITDAREEDELGVSERTCYNYSLRILPTPAAEITACSVFGAMYAIEGVLQMIGTPSGDVPGHLTHSTVAVTDGPQYAWRGLMIDSGRRFFPMPLVKNLLDTMAAVKLNVLHLHAADFCRFAVESKTFPNLTASLQGDRAGHYTHADIGAMISYAADRGIRVVPEFDVPGHSRGLLPIEPSVQFCEPSSPSRNQLYDDPEGHTYAAVHALLKEMAGIFSDDVMCAPSTHPEVARPPTASCSNVPATT